MSGSDSLKRRGLQAIDGSQLPQDYPDIGFFEIDRVVFPAEYDTLTASELGSSGRSIEWFRLNPQIYTVVLLDEQVIGYCNAMPLADAAFQAIVEGTLPDGEIAAADVRSFDSPGSYKVYLCSLAILPAFRRNGSAFRTLYRGVIEKLLNLAEAGICVSELAAVAWTEEGASICQKLGMNLRKRHEAYGDVYHVDLREVYQMPRALHALISRYRELGLINITTGR